MELSVRFGPLVKFDRFGIRILDRQIGVALEAPAIRFCSQPVLQSVPQAGQNGDSPLENLQAVLQSSVTEVR